MQLIKNIVICLRPDLQLIEKVVDKPFYDRWDYDNAVEDEYGRKSDVQKVERMSEENVVEGLHWINERFHIISNSGNDFPTIDWILEKARAAVLRYVCACMHVHACVLVGYVCVCVEACVCLKPLSSS